MINAWLPDKIDIFCQHYSSTIFFRATRYTIRAEIEVPPIWIMRNYAIFQLQLVGLFEHYYLGTFECKHYSRAVPTTRTSFIYRKFSPKSMFCTYKKWFSIWVEIEHKLCQKVVFSCSGSSFSKIYNFKHLLLYKKI